MLRRRQTFGVSDLPYLRRLHRHPPPAILEIEQHARADEVPAVAREIGRVLSTLVHAMQANRILEIGTSYGSATLWMALALPSAGKLWSIDPDAERTAVARSILDRAGCGERVEILNAPALQALPSFPARNLDVVFIDGLPSEYEAYLRLTIPLVKRSGLIVAAHLLADDRVANDPSAADSDETRALRAFNAAFLSHPQLDATILPVGDGLGIGALLD